MRWVYCGIAALGLLAASACDPAQVEQVEQVEQRSAAPVTTSTTSVWLRPSEPEPWPGRTRELRSGETVVADHLKVLGWWDGTRWQRPVEPMPIAARTPFEKISLVTRLGGPEASRGPVVLCGIGGDDPPGILTFPPLHEGEIAVAGVATVHPRRPGTERPNAVHQQAAVDVMRSLGVAEPIPRVEVVVDVDLEGDGTRERVIAADNGSIENFSYSYGQEDDASVVFVLHEDGRTSVVHQSVVTINPDEPGVPARLLLKITAVADLNGDGSLEVVVSSRYYEGGGTHVYSFDGGRPQLILEDGCGA